MNITLGAIKVYNELSEETNCFTANILVNGIKVGTAKNDGHGGCTGYYPNKNNEELFEKALDYCKTLPDYAYSDDFKVPMNMELMIDDLLEKHLFVLSIKKHFTKNVVWGKYPGEIKSLGYNISLSKIKKRSDGKEVIETLIKTVKDKMKPGDKIFNTNLKGFDIS